MEYRAEKFNAKIAEIIAIAAKNSSNPARFIAQALSACGMDSMPVARYNPGDSDETIQAAYQVALEKLEQVKACLQ